MWFGTSTPKTPGGAAESDDAALTGPPPQELGEEVAVVPADITTGQLVDYARSIGIPARRIDLFWIAEHGLTAPLPKAWKACATAGDARGVKRKYYYNTQTGQGMWEHPLDRLFRELAQCFRGGDGDRALRRDACVQAAVPVAAAGAQAGPEQACAGSQAVPASTSEGCLPMPLACTTMTATHSEEMCTMTTPTIEPLVPATESVGVGPSHPAGAVHAAASRHSGRQSVKSLPDFFRLTPGPGAGASGGGVGGGGGAPSQRAASKAQEPDELTKRIVEEFQASLSSHKKEVMDIMTRDKESRLPSPAPAGDERAMLPDFAPVEVPKAEEWSTARWVASYGALGLGHALLCVCVLYVLPFVLVDEAVTSYEPTFG